jgi:hypothetical protein
LNKVKETGPNASGADGLLSSAGFASDEPGVLPLQPIIKTSKAEMKPHAIFFLTAIRISPYTHFVCF